MTFLCPVSTKVETFIFLTLYGFTTIETPPYEYRLKIKNVKKKSKNF